MYMQAMDSSTNSHTCIYIYIYTYIYTYKYTCVHICTYVHIYIYTNMIYSGDDYFAYIQFLIPMTFLNAILIYIFLIYIQI